MNGAGRVAELFAGRHEGLASGFTNTIKIDRPLGGIRILGPL
jgi:hypothetical protein